MLLEMHQLLLSSLCKQDRETQDQKTWFNLPSAVNTYTLLCILVLLNTIKLVGLGWFSFLPSNLKFKISN